MKKSITQVRLEEINTVKQGYLPLGRVTWVTSCHFLLMCLQAPDVPLQTQTFPPCPGKIKIKKKKNDSPHLTHHTPAYTSEGCISYSGKFRAFLWDLAPNHWTACDQCSWVSLSRRINLCSELSLCHGIIDLTWEMELKSLWQVPCH